MLQTHWLPGWDLNPRSLTYEDSEITTSLPGVKLKSLYHKTGARRRTRTSVAPKGVCSTGRCNCRSTIRALKWRKVDESNAHPEGAPVFKAGRITISSTFQTGGSQRSLTVIPKEPSFSKRIDERRLYDPKWRKAGYLKTSPFGPHRFPIEP
jgi:hypothetical protein